MENNEELMLTHKKLIEAVENLNNVLTKAVIEILLKYNVVDGKEKN